MILKCSRFFKRRYCLHTPVVIILFFYPLSLFSDSQVGILFHFTVWLPISVLTLEQKFPFFIFSKKKFSKQEMLSSDCLLLKLYSVLIEIFFLMYSMKDFCSVSDFFFLLLIKSFKSLAFLDYYNFMRERKDRNFFVNIKKRLNKILVSK